MAVVTLNAASETVVSETVIIPVTTTLVVTETTALTTTNGISTTVAPVPGVEVESSLLLSNKLFLPVVASEQ